MKNKEKVLVQMLLPVTNILRATLKNPVIRLEAGRHWVHIVTKEKLANSHLCFLHCPASPRFSSRFILNALSNCPTECPNCPAVTLSCSEQWGRSIINNHYSCSTIEILFLFVGPMSFSFILSFSHLFDRYSLNPPWTRHWLEATIQRWVR